MKKTVVLILSIVFAVCLAGSARAAQEKSLIQKLRDKLVLKQNSVIQTPQPEKTISKPEKEMTKEETALNLKKLLKSEKSVMNFIPGLKLSTTELGEEVYTYQGIKLEDLDKETLNRVYGRVRTEMVRIRTERLTKQLEMIKRSERLSAQTRMGAAGVGAPPTPPRVVSAPPSSPQIPKAPPRVPSIPRR